MLSNTVKKKKNKRKEWLSLTCCTFNSSCISHCCESASEVWAKSMALTFLLSKGEQRILDSVQGKTRETLQTSLCRGCKQQQRFFPRIEFLDSFGTLSQKGWVLWGYLQCAYAQSINMPFSSVHTVNCYSVVIIRQKKRILEMRYWTEMKKSKAPGSNLFSCHFSQATCFTFLLTMYS